MATHTREDGRSMDTLRPVQIELGVQRNPEGSVLYRSGNTSVLIASSIQEGVRPWLAGKGRGWVTGEYCMHPRANPSRQERAGRRGRVDGRATEIERLIGRALRAAVLDEALGERTITIDCDVLDADGGTRTASISGGYVALVLSLDHLRKRGLIGDGVLREPVAAVSVGFREGHPLLDLDYQEDSSVDVDLNVVATASGRIVEVQGTAEGEPIPKGQFDAMLDLALVGIEALVREQQQALDAAGVEWKRLIAR